MDVFRNIASSLNKRFQMTIWTIKFAFLSIGFGCTMFWSFKCGIPYCFNLLPTSVPRIWMSFRSWLAPPYLYILVNIIIIGIAASSSYQQRLHKEEDDEEHKKKERHKERQQQLNESNLSSSDDVVPKSGDMFSDDKKTSLSVSWLEKNNIVLDAGGGETRSDDASSCVITSTEFENKPHLGTKKLTKAYRRTVSAKVPSLSHSLLSATNVKKKQEETNVESNDNTLDSMWKAITEGKEEPQTRQLKKSDTWDVTPNVMVESGSTRPELRKSETFNDAAAPAPASSTTTSCGSSTGRASVLRRAAEKSLGVDELNWRVEAFINKFKNDIRLQREESDVRYMEMVNRSVC